MMKVIGNPHSERRIPIAEMFVKNAFLTWNVGDKWISVQVADQKSWYLNRWKIRKVDICTGGKPEKWVSVQVEDQKSGYLNRWKIRKVGI